MSDEWVGIVKSTMPKYMKGSSDATIRRRLLLSMLRRKGQIEYNQAGDECKWQVEYSQPPIVQHGDGGLIDFSNHDAFLQLTLGWRGYIGTDAISMKQKEMNKGDQALINLFQTKQNRLRKSITNTFAGEIYKDGNAAGRENSVHGLESGLAERATPVATDRIAEPGDTYAGLTTNLAAQGGSWSSDLSTSPNATLAKDWPDGNGTSEYDALSPILINWSASNWGTGSTTWEDNCWRVVSQMITWLATRGGDEATPDIVMMASNLFQGYKNHEEAIRRINVPHKVANDLGFAGNVLNQDGSAISSDFDCTANTAYGINLSEQKLSSLTPELFWMEGPDKDPRSGWSHLWGTGFYGNLKWNFHNIAKAKNYA